MSEVYALGLISALRSGKVHTKQIGKEETRRLRRHLKRLDEIRGVLRSSVV